MTTEQNSNKIRCPKCQGRLLIIFTDSDDRLKIINCLNCGYTEDKIIKDLVTPKLDGREIYAKVFKYSLQHPN